MVYLSLFVKHCKIIMSKNIVLDKLEPFFEITVFILNIQPCMSIPTVQTQMKLSLKGNI